MKFDGEDMRRTLEDPNFPPLLILLDALNELPTQKQVTAAKAVKDFCDWIEELNKKRHDHKHRVILTYRKEPHVESLVSKSLLLETGAEYELQRLSLQDVQIYLDRANVPANLRNLFSSEVQDLFTVPLFMFFAEELAGLPEEELKQITNKALLYKAVTRQWLRREWWDDRTKSFKLDTVFTPITAGKAGAIGSLEHCVDFHARALGEIAYHMTEKGLTELPEKEISKIVRDFVKKELSQRQLQEFAAEGPWQWLRDDVEVIDVSSWAREEGNGFEDFIRLVTESLLRSTVLQAI